MTEPAAIAIKYADDVPADVMTVEDIERCILEQFPGGRAVEPDTEEDF